MSRASSTPPELIERWRADEERRLGADEFDARVNAPMSETERDDLRALISWFCRRYPTAGERLAAHRRLELQRRRS